MHHATWRIQVCSVELGPQWCLLALRHPRALKGRKDKERRGRRGGEGERRGGKGEMRGGEEERREGEGKMKEGEGERREREGK